MAKQKLPEGKVKRRKRGDADLLQEEKENEIARLKDDRRKRRKRPAEDQRRTTAAAAFAADEQALRNLAKDFARRLSSAGSPPEDAEQLSCLLRENLAVPLMSTVEDFATWHRILSCSSAGALKAALGSLSPDEASLLLRRLLSVRALSLSPAAPESLHCRGLWVRSLLHQFPSLRADVELVKSKNMLQNDAMTALLSQDAYSRCYARLTTVLDQCYRAELRRAAVQAPPLNAS